MAPPPASAVPDAMNSPVSRPRDSQTNIDIMAVIIDASGLYRIAKNKIMINLKILDKSSEE